MNVSVIIATYGDREWEAMAWNRANPSAEDQHPYELLVLHHGLLESIAQARNAASQHAHGDWLCFLDADDELAPGYLDAMKRAAERAGDGPVLFTPAVQFVRKGRRGEPHFLDRGTPLTDDNWLVVGTLIQRDLFMAVGGFSDYPHGFEDFSLWSKAWRVGARVVKVPDAIYVYHWNPQSVHKRQWRNRAWQVATHNQVISELDSWERFWTKVEFTSGCWFWKAAKNADGYGSVGIGDGKTDLAHRVAYRERKGEITDGMYVLHTCDEPCCVNPDHLFLGTQADNVRDCAEKGRRNQTRYKKLDAERHQQIRDLYATGDYSLAALGRQFGVTYQTIRHVVHSG